MVRTGLRRSGLQSCSREASDIHRCAHCDVLNMPNCLACVLQFHATAQPVDLLHPPNLRLLAAIDTARTPYRTLPPRIVPYHIDVLTNITHGHFLSGLLRQETA